MLSLFGIGAIDILGIALDYLVSGVLIAAGLYLFGTFRWLGLVTIVAGTLVGAVAYGKTLTAADCIAAGRLAATENQLKTAQRDLGVWKKTAELRAEQLRELSRKRDDANAHLTQWQDRIAKLEESARRCRAATRDDDRRLCALVGNRAPGCRADR